MKIIKTETIGGYIINTYDNGTVEKYPVPQSVPEPEPEPTEQDIFQAQTLLNQAEIITKQADMDVVLAAILLNQTEV